MLLPIKRIFLKLKIDSFSTFIASFMRIFRFTSAYPSSGTTIGFGVEKCKQISLLFIGTLDKKKVEQHGRSTRKTSGIFMQHFQTTKQRPNPPHYQFTDAIKILENFHLEGVFLVLRTYSGVFVGKVRLLCIQSPAIDSSKQGAQFI